MNRRLLPAFLLVLAAACSGNLSGDGDAGSPPHAGPGSDAGSDAGGVAGTDAGSYAGVDALSLAVSPSSANVGVGQAMQLVATLTLSNSTIIYVTADPATRWSSDTPANATVVPTGKGAGTVAGVALGTATVTATWAPAGISPLSGHAKITVRTFTGVRIWPEPIVLDATLNATKVSPIAYRQYNDGTEELITDTNLLIWSTDDSSLVSVSKGAYSGLGTNGAAHAIAEYSGAGQINNAWPTGIAAVHLNLLSVAPPSLLAPINLAAPTYTASLKRWNGTQADVSQYSTWASTVPAVATIYSTGATTLLTHGATDISAAYPVDGITCHASTTLTVTQ